MRAFLLAAGLLCGAAPLGAQELAITAASTFGVPPMGIFGGVTESERGSVLVRMEWRKRLDSSRVSAVIGMAPMELQIATPGAGTVSGLGMDPLGIDVRLGPVHLGARAGMRWFMQPVPVQESQRFAFAIDILAGVRLGRAEFGLDYHHVSNAGLARRNPGVNYLLMVAGWRLR